MTPEQHAKAIEDAAMLFATINRQRIPKLSEIEALRSAIRAGVGAAPEGWQLIPVEPTIAMVAALAWDGDEGLAIGHASISCGVEPAYRAMLAAAPKP